MGGFFNLDGPFYKYGNLLADILVLSLLWIVCSLPIITIGASTTSLYYVMTRRISDKEKSIVKDFFTSFRHNFKTATLAFLTLAALFIVLTLNIMNIELTGNMQVFLLPFQYCFFIEAIFVSIFIFPVLSRFDMKYTQLFKTAFFMANRHLLTTLLCMVTLVGVVLLSFFLGPFILVAAGVYALLTSYLFMSRFKKYRPEIDAEVDYEELRLKLRNNTEQQGDSEAVFNDAVGLLIEKQALEKQALEKQESKNKKRNTNTRRKYR